MSENEIIIADLTAPVLDVNPEWLERRDNLRTNLLEIGAVLSADAQALAVDAGVNARRFVKEVEASRVIVGKPLLETTRAINDLAKKLTEPVLAEMQRVGKLVSDFQAKESERVRKEEEARQAEIQKRIEEETKRIAEAELAASKITNEAELAAAIAKEDQAKSAVAAAQAAIVAPLPKADKAQGAATRMVMRFEVTDIHALYKARPELCRIEANLGAIRACCAPNMTIPGLRLWQERDTSFRAR